MASLREQIYRTTDAQPYLRGVYNAGLRLSGRCAANLTASGVGAADRIWSRVGTMMDAKPLRRHRIDRISPVC